MNEDTYIQPGLAGIFLNTPAYAYMGPVEALRNVDFSYPALQAYFNQSTPEQNQALVADNTLAQNANKSNFNWNKIATGNKFKENSELLGSVANMYQDLIKNIHPQAAKTKNDDIPEEDIGWPRLLLLDKNLEDALASYSPDTNRINYPVYENLFIPAGYYETPNHVAGQRDGKPAMLGQYIKHNDIFGKLGNLAYAHELGHAFDNRAAPETEIISFIDRALNGENARRYYFASEDKGQDLWPWMLRSFALSKPESLSSRINTNEAFAELFERAINQELSQRSASLKNIPYAELYGYYVPDKVVESGKKAYENALTQSYKYGYDVNDALKIGIAGAVNNLLGISYERDDPEVIANRYMRDYRKSIGTPVDSREVDTRGYRYANAQDMGNFLDYFFANIYPKW